MVKNMHHMVLITYLVTEKQHGLIAKYILDGINENSKNQYEIDPVNSDYFKTDVKRPKYSVLSIKKIKEQFDIEIRQYYADKYMNVSW